MTARSRAVSVLRNSSTTTISHFSLKMSLGLVLGLMLTRPIRFSRLALGLAMAMPMWVAVVLSGSRAGLGAFIGQVLFVALVVFVASRASSY